MTGEPANPLRTPAFARLWTAGLLSEIGDWLLHISLPLFVLGLTGSALVTALTFVLGLLPSLLCAPIAGVLADRWDRRRLLVWVSVAQAVTLLPLLFVRDAGQLWLVLAVTGAQAALAATFEPTKNALVPTLLADRQLVAANGLVGFAASIGRLVGGPVGGIFLQWWGIRSVVLADAASFLVVAALVAIRTHPHRMPVSTPRPGLGPGRWVDGLRIACAPGPLRRIAVVAGVMGVAQGMFVTLFVFWVTGVLGAGDAETGVLRGVQAIGGVVGGLAAGRLARRWSPRVLAGASFAVFAVIGFAGWNGPLLTTALWVYAGLFAVIGAPAVTGVAGLLTLLQLSLTDEQRGRALGGFQAIGDGAQAVGMLAAGTLTGVLPLLVLLNTQMALYLLAGALLVLPGAPAQRRSATVRTPEASERLAEPRGGRSQ